jgi:hypothetical protein
MRSHAVVIVRIVFQNPTQMFLVQDNDVVQTLAPDRTDQPFGICVVKSSQLHSYRLIGRKHGGNGLRHRGHSGPPMGVQLRLGLHVWVILRQHH